MNTPRKIEGQWWIHGDEEPAHFGVLSFHPEEGLNLEVQIPRRRESADEIVAMFVDKIEPRSEIRGLDSSGHPVTLFGCGRWNWSKKLGLDTCQVHGQTVILDYHGTWRDAHFPIAKVKYTLLSNWMNRRLFSPKDKEEIRYSDGLLCLKSKVQEDFVFELSWGGRLRLAGETMRSFSSDDIHLRWEHSAWFLFPQPLPASVVYHDYASVLLRLLCLLTGELVFIDAIVFWDGDPFAPGEKRPLRGHELLTTSKGILTAERDTYAERMVASYDEIGSGFASVVNRWFEYHERLRPVLDLQSAVISNQVLTDESRFLFLVQALEVYHARSGRWPSVDLSEEDHRQRVDEILAATPEKSRRWLSFKLEHANQKMLAQRLDDIFTWNRDEFQQLAAGIERFPDKVRVSRNYYTHYSERLLASRDLAKGIELRRIAYVLADLLDVCLLKELDIVGKPIKKILDRNASMKWEEATTETRPPSGDPDYSRKNQVLDSRHEQERFDHG